MAIEDMIAGGIRPPQVEDIQTAAARGLTLGHALQQQRLGQLQVAQAEQDARDQQMVRDAFMRSGGDRKKFRDTIISRGVSPKTVMALDQAELANRKSLADLSETEQKNLVQRHDALRGELESFSRLPADQKQGNWQSWIDQHVQSGRLTPDEAKGLPAQYPGDDQLRFHANSLALGSQLLKEEMERRNAAARETTAKTASDRLNIERSGLEAQSTQRGLALAGQSVDAIANQDQYNAFRATLPDDVKRRIPGMFSPAAVQMVKRMALTPEQQTTADQAKTNSDETRRYHDAELKNRDRELGLTAQRIGLERDRLFQDREETKLTPEALDKVAEMFATTGQLPSLGVGKNGSALRSAVINRASALYPQVQFATNRAAFDANSQSLKKAQSLLDAVDAAERTAGRNLDQFLSVAKNQFDSGIPWLNTPVRLLDEKLVGAANMAAVNAGRQTAINEIAKVLNNPNGGAAISDSARHEVNELIGKDPTMKQIYAASQILRQDMRNRHEEYSQQIDAIQNRIKGATAAAAPAAQATHVFNPKTGQIEAK